MPGRSVRVIQLQYLFTVKQGLFCLLLITLYGKKCSSGLSGVFQNIKSPEDYFHSPLDAMLVHHKVAPVLVLPKPINLPGL